MSTAAPVLERPREREFTCTCMLCDWGRARDSEPPDFERMDRLMDALVEHGCERDMYLYHLLDSAEKAARQKGAPKYLREAVARVRGDLRRSSDEFMQRPHDPRCAPGREEELADA